MIGRLRPGLPVLVQGEGEVPGRRDVLQRVTGRTSRGGGSGLEACEGRNPASGTRGLASRKSQVRSRAEAEGGGRPRVAEAEGGGGLHTGARQACWFWEALRPGQQDTRGPDGWPCLKAGPAFSSGRGAGLHVLPLPSTCMAWPRWGALEPRHLPGVGPGSSTRSPRPCPHLLRA